MINLAARAVLQLLHHVLPDSKSDHYQPPHRRYLVWSYLLVAFIGILSPAQALDLYVGEVPFGDPTPQIDNLATLKRYHLRDLETAQNLSVSCYVYCYRTCSGGPLMPVCEKIPNSVDVAFSLVENVTAVIRTVTDTFAVSWTGFVYDDTFEILYAEIPSTALPLSGLNLGGHQYRVTAEVDPDDKVSETNESNNNEISEDSFYYSIYSGDLYYDAILTRLSSLQLSGLCLFGSLPMGNSVTEWTHEWGITSFAPTTGCGYTSTLNDDGFSYDILAKSTVTPVDLGSLSGTTPSGLDATLNGVTIDGLGAHYTGVEVELPDTVTLHQLKNTAQPEEGVRPVGLTRVPFAGAGDFYQIYDIGTLVWSTPHAYHGYGLPFYLPTREVAFRLGDTKGLLFEAYGVHCHYPALLRLNPDDARSTGRTGFPTNDLLFYHPMASAPTDAEITPQGIDATGLFFDKPGGMVADPRTAFPRGRMNWTSSFQTDVDDNQIVPMAVPVDRVWVGSMRTCPDANCGEPKANAYYMVDTQDGNAWMTADGGVGSPIKTLKGNTEWGQFESGRGTFERNDSDISGLYYMPGYLMSKTASTYTVAQLLLGARLFDDGGKPGTLAALNENDAVKGNGAFAGLTMGPEYLDELDSGAGQDLVDDQRIRFNGNASYTNFEITPYTKYFLRQSGVTGVFNTTFSGTINIYNYDLKFRRFAFRQVYNIPDEKTFLDGTLNLPYPCDFTVAFLDLDLTCSGDLASGQIDSEPEPDWTKPDEIDNDGDFLVDEGNVVLSYWRTPAMLTGLAFVATADSGDVCLDNKSKELQLSKLLNTNGIDDKLTMNAIYPPDGMIKDQQLTGSVENMFDRPDSGDDEGFAVRLQKAYLNQLASYGAQKTGFINLTGLTDVPLFNDLELLLHLDNPEVSGLALPDGSFDINVFKDESDLDSDFNGVPDTYGSNVTTYREMLSDTEDKPESGDPRPRAKYSWPSSGILELNYALNYNRSADESMPQFLGVKKTYGLISDSNPVITISSVPDYINPIRTKFSFGASADIAAIANLQVNLSDLGDIDDLLHNYLGVSPSFSLENMLNGLLDAESLVREITGGDLTQILAVVLDSLLDSPVIDGPLDDFADAIGALNRLPQELANRSVGVLELHLEDLLGQLTSTGQPITGAGGQLEDLFAELAAYVAAPADYVNTIPGNPYSPEQQEELVLKLQALQDALNQFDNTMDQLLGGVGTAKNEISNVVGQAGNYLTTASNLLTAIQGNILSAGGSLGSLVLGNDANQIINKIDQIKDAVQQALAALKSIDLTMIANAIQTAVSLSGSSIDLSMLDSMVAQTNTLISSLENVVQQAETLLSGQYTSMPDVFDDANNTLNQVVSGLNTVKTQIDSAKSVVIGFLESAETQIGMVKSQVSGLKDLLGAEVAIPDGALYPDYNSLVALGQQKLNQFAETLVNAMIDQLSPGLLLDALQTMQANIGSNPAKAFEIALQDGLVSIVQTAVQEFADEITNQLTSIIENALAVLPTPTADDIKKLIRNAILNSDPVEELNAAFAQLIKPVSEMVDGVAMQLTTAINNLIKQALAAVEEGINDALESITSQIADFDLVGGKLDGYALVTQDELEHLHIEAEFTFGGDPDPTTYYAALDITSWNAENGKGACVDGGTGMIDAVISTRDISAEMLGADIGIKEAALGFTIDNAVPIGVFGRVYTSGELNFEAIVIYDIGLEAGLGAIENYLGATAAGRFDSYTLPKVAFYFGKTCDFGVLRRLDSEVAEFVGERVPLIGIYVRGSAEVPIYNVGCFFRVGVGADVGAWIFEGVYGGLVGGSAWGQLGCLASLKGKITCMAQKSGDQFQFSGSGWAGAGVGWCSPSKWKSVSDVRKDDWCVTGDASFGATYTNGWNIDGPNVNCCN